MKDFVKKDTGVLPVSIKEVEDKIAVENFVHKSIA